MGAPHTTGPDEELVGTAMTQREQITELADGTKQGLELARQFVAVVGAIGSMSWGKGLTPGIRKAIAEYCRVYDVDPLTELDVLGGSFYVNAEWYLRKLGDLRRQRVVEDFWLEHIQADPRLKAMIEDESLPAEVRAEAVRRWTDAMFKRVEHNAPENAAAVCVAYIKLPGGGTVVKGCKWGGNGTSVLQPRSGGGSSPNPIVENNAALSVESQAIRRAMRQVQSHVSTGRMLPNVEAMESELTKITARMTAVVDHQESIDDRAEAEHHAPRPLITEGSAGYAPADLGNAAREPVRVVDREAAVAEAQRAVSTMADPYGEPHPRFTETGGEIRPLAFNVGDEVIDLRPREEDQGALDVGAELDGGPARTAPAGSEARAELETRCGECNNVVRPRHPEDHKAVCSKYAD